MFSPPIKCGQDLHVESVTSLCPNHPNLSALDLTISSSRCWVRWQWSGWTSSISFPGSMPLSKQKLKMARAEQNAEMFWAAFSERDASTGLPFWMFIWYDHYEYGKLETLRFTRRPETNDFHLLMLSVNIWSRKPSDQLKFSLHLIFVGQHIWTETNSHRHKLWPLTQEMLERFRPPNS